MAAAEESVNILSVPSLILFVIGTADDAADTNRYATICNPQHFFKVHVETVETSRGAWDMHQTNKSQELGVYV